MSLRDHLQSQSRESKSRYAFGIAGAVTGIIALIWVSTLPSRFASIPETQVDSEDSEEFVEFLDETKTQVGNALQWTEPERETETTNLDLLLSGEATGSVEASTSPEWTYPEPGEVEEPRTILIGTTTEGGG